MHRLRTAAYLGQYKCTRKNSFSMLMLGHLWLTLCIGRASRSSGFVASFKTDDDDPFIRSALPSYSICWCYVSQLFTSDHIYIFPSPALISCTHSHTRGSFFTLRPRSRANIFTCSSPISGKSIQYYIFRHHANP